MIGGDEAGALGDGNQGAEVVKEIDEEEDEDDFKQPFASAPRISSLKEVCAERLNAAALVGVQ